MSENELDMMHHEESATVKKLREHLKSKIWCGRKRKQGDLLLVEYDALAIRREHLRDNKTVSQIWLGNLAELVVDFKSHSIKIDAEAEDFLSAIAYVAVGTKCVEGEAKDNICDALDRLLEAYEERMERLI